jgi:hypothetical protein
MFESIRFRKLLPSFQIVLALLFGSWGLRLRALILNRPFLGGTLWDSTARFHVWPWPLKLAIVINLPAVLVGAISLTLLNGAGLHLPEWVSYLLLLPFVALFWFLIGAWIDRNMRENANSHLTKRIGVGILFFTLTCAAVSSVPQTLGGEVSFVSLGALSWIAWLIASPSTMRSLRRRTDT